MSDLKGAGFGLIPVESISKDEEVKIVYKMDPNWIDMVRIERAVPAHMEEIINDAIDNVLKMHGYTKDML